DRAGAKMKRGGRSSWPCFRRCTLSPVDIPAPPGLLLGRGLRGMVPRRLQVCEKSLSVGQTHECLYMPTRQGEPRSEFTTHVEVGTQRALKPESNTATPGGLELEALDHGIIKFHEFAGQGEQALEQAFLCGEHE